MAHVGVPDGRWFSTVPLGPKSRIVTPQEVRAVFGLGPGDTLLFVADPERGNALVDHAVHTGVVNKILGVDHRADGSTE